MTLNFTDFVRCSRACHYRASASGGGCLCRQRRTHGACVFGRLRFGRPGGQAEAQARRRRVQVSPSARCSLTSCRPSRSLQVLCSACGGRRRRRRRPLHNTGIGMLQHWLGRLNSQPPSQNSSRLHPVSLCSVRDIPAILPSRATTFTFPSLSLHFPFT